MGFGTREASAKWIFGSADPSSLAGLGPGQGANVLGSTGAFQTPYNANNLGDRYTFYVEADAANTCAYQIRTGRTSSGPWRVLSSNTLTSNALDIVQVSGPLAWVSPLLKTIKSTTAAQVTIRMVGLS